jgi:hypothetical protein
LLLQRVRGEVSEDVWSVVLVGACRLPAPATRAACALLHALTWARTGTTSTGKSLLLNLIGMLSEADESTYASREHKAGTQSFQIRGEPYSLEAIGVIAGLLRDEHGIAADEVQAKLDSIVELRSPPELTPALAAAENLRQKQLAHDKTYAPVADFAFAGKSTFPRFLLPSGTRCGVTTSLSTMNRYGGRYHTFAETYSEDDLRARLHKFLVSERTLWRSPDFSAAVEALDKDETEDRQFNFLAWNACVAQSLALGEGGLDELQIEVYAECTFDEQPDILKSEVCAAAKDIELHEEVQTRLGRFIIYAGRGEHLAIDREFVRHRLEELTSAGAHTRESYILRHLWCFGPWAVLQGGKEVVDAPGTADNTPLHRKQLEDACENADHIILMAPKNVAAPTDTLEVVASNGVLQKFLDPESNLQLTIIHNHEKQCIGLQNFRNRVSEDEAKACQASVNALVKQLKKQSKKTVEELRSMVARRVRVLTVHMLLYAGLKLFPDRDVALTDRDELLKHTQGATLLGLFEGMNLERVCESVEGLQTGPLASARAAVASRIVQAQPRPGGAALRTTANALATLATGERVPGKFTRMWTGILRTLEAQFDTVAQDPPRRVLQEETTAAYAAFCDALDVHFDGAAGEATRECWLRARPRFVKPENVAKAQKAHVLLGNQSSACPYGMDLRSLLCGSLSLPANAVATLMEHVEAALASTADACGTLLKEQLVAIAGHDEAQTALARTLIVQEFAQIEGRSILQEPLAGLSAKFSKTKLTRMLNKEKEQALQAEIACRAPQAAAGDAAGVATLVDDRISALVAAVKTRVKNRMRVLLDELCAEATVALKPNPSRRGGGFRAQPAMVEYVQAACEYVETALDPTDSETRLQALQKLRMRGDDAAARIGQLVQALRAALGDISSLGAAAERYQDAIILFRQLQEQFPSGAALPRPEHLNQQNCRPLPVEPGWRPLNERVTTIAAFKRALATAADVQHMPLVRTALAAQQPVPLRDLDPTEHVEPCDSLWYALAHQLFMTQGTDAAISLKDAVLMRMLQYYGAPQLAERFRTRYFDGVTVKQRVEDLRSGRCAAGLFELVMAANLYNVQVCVWPAAPADPASPKAAASPLLVFHGNRPLPRAYNVVLAGEPVAFCSVVRRKAAGVSWSSRLVEERRFDLLPGEERGLKPAPPQSQSKRVAKEGGSAGVSDKRACS